MRVVAAPAQRMTRTGNYVLTQRNAVTPDLDQITHTRCQVERQQFGPAIRIPAMLFDFIEITKKYCAALFRQGFSTFKPVAGLIQKFLHCRMPRLFALPGLERQHIMQAGNDWQNGNHTLLQYVQKRTDIADG